MFGALLIFAAGLFAWTLLEYLIHGTLSHVFATPIASLHDVHHRDPHAVFTVRAWVPVTLVYLAGLAIFGAATGMIFLSGVVAGFIGYEAVHYRIHFARPGSRFEAHLRARHLAHHALAPNAYFGVTNAVWDRVFGSEPDAARMRELEASVANTPPLAGPTNLGKLWSFPGPRAG